MLRFRKLEWGDTYITITPSRQSHLSKSNPWIQKIIAPREFPHGKTLCILEPFLVCIQNTYIFQISLPLSKKPYNILFSASLAFPVLIRF